MPGGNDGIRVLEELVCQAIPDESIVSRGTGERAHDGEGNAVHSMPEALRQPLEVQHEALLRFGKARFGTPSSEIEGQIRGIVDDRRLSALYSRVSRVASWQELLSEV